MQEIKSMLNDFGQRNQQKNAERISDMIGQIDASDNLAVAGLSMIGESYNQEDDTQMEDWIKRQKAEIKDL